MNTPDTPPACACPAKSKKKGCLIGCAVAAAILAVLAIIAVIVAIPAFKKARAFGDELLREGEKYVIEFTNAVERIEVEQRAKQSE